ncbi:MAG: metallophosphoesterase [Lachnospiraceae bacterium]|nr:metallophosphoesterase [Lachnospiraceae bacterium]
MQAEGTVGKEKDKATDKATGKRIRRVGIRLLLLVLFFSLWSWIPVTEQLEVDLLEGDDACVRLVLITDLHSCYYGRGQKTLIRMVEKARPDIVMLGGDFFDDRLADDNARITAEVLAQKYPCYYVTGNHEYWSGRADEMKDYLRELGITVLEGECDSISVNGCLLDVCGVDDPTYIGERLWKTQIEQAFAQTDESHLRILLSHRPEKGNIYAQYDFDLILAGHAHAGQFRIPFLNEGVWAPDQGLLAKYVNGLYELSNGSIMEVSRGLARESTPLPRFFNHPEIVAIEIR